MLEVWRGRQFLGEALLPSRRQIHAASSEVGLDLETAATTWPTRPDENKTTFPSLPSQQNAHGRKVQGGVQVTVEWVRDETTDVSLMRFCLLKGTNLLPPQSSESRSGIRVLLWLRRWGQSDFNPLWTSREAPETDGSQVSWNEVVDLNLGCTGIAEPPQSPGSATRGAPVVCSTVALKQPTKQPQTQPAKAPVAYQTSIKSPHEHLCGATLSAHWGMCEEDGSMRTHILAGQVSHRLTASRYTRSNLLSTLAGQLEQYHGLQTLWEKQSTEAKGVIARQEDEIQCRSRELGLVQQETEQILKMHESSLASVCKEMYAVVNERNMRQHADDLALEQSKQRVHEQATMATTLAEKSTTLQESIDKTVRKFDEVSSSYAALQKELARRQASRSHVPALENDPANATSQLQTGQQDAGQEERELATLKAYLDRAHADLTVERQQSIKLEEFVKRIATAPPTRMRTGGGYDLEYTARREAEQLIREMSRMTHGIT